MSAITFSTRISMAHTYHQHLYHLVWSTKEREQLILPEYKERIFQFLGGAFKNADCNIFQVGGMPDHVHILLGIPPKYAVSEIIRDVKVCSSKWIAHTFPQCRNFSWQEGFGSFTVSASQKDNVFQYIVNQEHYHKTRTFREEFIELIIKHGIQFDEKYLWC